MVLSTLVRRYDRSFVVHLLEPAINLCLYGDLCNLGVQYKYTVGYKVYCRGKLFEQEGYQIRDPKILHPYIIKGILWQ